MLRIIFAGIIIFLSPILSKANVILSPKANISVLTCSQGEELYSAFGHTALRVSDPENDIDLVFNYGTFDFNTPNFYLKFANGKLNYMLSISKYERFLPEYYRDKRSVTEQILKLNAKDKQSIFNALIVNYKPENRFYKYDFFYDNCATRIFDIVYNNVEGTILLGKINNTETNGITFREYLHHYLKGSPWIETGLNAILGLPADKVATQRESTYLPYFLMGVIDEVRIKDEAGNIEQLVDKKTELLEFEDNNEYSFHILNPIGLFSILLVFMVLLGVKFSQFRKLNSILNRVIFFTVGFIGVLISYLWFVTDHVVTGNNLNIIWAFPTFLILSFSNWNSKISKILIKIHALLLIVFLLGWFLLPQSFPSATIPMALLLIIRLILILKQNKSSVV